MADEVIVDALPYFDQGYDDPGIKEAALALIEEETKRYRPTKNYLEFLPPPNYKAFETDIMKNEWERMQARIPMDSLSMKRCELPQPPTGKMTDVQSWLDSVHNSEAQLEHQFLRIQNLELLQEYGSTVWKSSNEILVKMLEESQSQLQEIRRKIQDINWQRKSEQIEAGTKLKNLEDSWVGLVSKNYEIERVCLDLENQLVVYQQYHEQQKQYELAQKQYEQQYAQQQQQQQQAAAEQGETNQEPSSTEPEPPSETDTAAEQTS